MFDQIIDGLDQENIIVTEMKIYIVKIKKEK